jgi:hypothetical protein
MFLPRGQFPQFLLDRVMGQTNESDGQNELKEKNVETCLKKEKKIEMPTNWPNLGLKLIHLKSTTISSTISSNMSGSTQQQEN